MTPPSGGREFSTGPPRVAYYDRTTPAGEGERVDGQARAGTGPGPDDPTDRARGMRIVWAIIGELGGLATVGDGIS